MNDLLRFLPRFDLGWLGGWIAAVLFGFSASSTWAEEELPRDSSPDRTALLQWADDVLAMHLPLDAPDVAAWKHRAQHLPASQTGKWLAEADRITPYLKSQRWTETADWLAGMLATARPGVDARVDAFRNRARDLSPVELYELLRKIELTRQQFHEQRAARDDLRRESLARNEYDLRRQDRRQDYAIRARFRGGDRFLSVTKAIGRDSRRYAYRYSRPLITSFDVAVGAVWRALF